MLTGLNLARWHLMTGTLGPRSQQKSFSPRATCRIEILSFVPKARYVQGQNEGIVGRVAGCELIFFP